MVESLDMEVKKVKLNTGLEMPCFGLGTANSL